MHPDRGDATDGAHVSWRSCVQAVGLALAASGCIAPSTGTPSTADLAGFDVVPSIEIELTEHGFSPDAVEIDANTTISVVNRSRVDRSAVQLDEPVDRRFATGPLLPGDVTALHFADPGTVELTDEENGTTLIVTVGPEAPSEDPTD